MKKTTLIAAMALAGMAGAVQAVELSYSGYVRAGTGINVRGGTQVCFGLAGADTKWRLGNECDYVIEPNFVAKLASYEGSDWYVHVMPSVYHGWGPQGTNEPDTLTTRFGQIYAYGDKISGLANGKVWAGRRFYNRLQTGINDQFLENNDGNGAGIEEMDFGAAKVSVAFMMDPNNEATNNRFALPIRATGIKTLPNGELSVYVTPSAQLKSKNQVTLVEPADQPKGIAVGLYQTVNGALGGNWLLGFKHDKTGDVKNTRVIAQYGSSLTPATALDVVAEYRINTAPNDGGNKWLAIGARTDTHLGGPFRLLFEAGHDQVKPDAGDTRNMTKFTVAAAASAGKDAGSRPTVRLFLTHAIWNEAARQTLSGRTQEVFGDKKSGTSIGIQAETWW
ncbi:MAG TPA: carbohydrate porin [Piscinibacter sp.]|uniref:carbohydrate porin n=1 Tax=Piscinibacter sp. TaxID=1903157 RepID=UPI001B7AF243|nr:carbohydrate porin [Piscinibacter sp.]MBK7533307.1 carbohydrate porin [Piscinibacter sp.]MBP6543563.1 carbohydrate porin [Piscinibacter sp.]HNW62470.1 carbohydrate porin [Piscinibacter sp.]HOY36354.1 carbohydrate porin [Piscinibacter sp.]HPM67317.1 carbohydrate porin [Piscinibacter sp.]